MPEPLIYTDSPFAVPAFRTLLYLDGSLNDEVNAAGITRLFDLFFAHFGEDAAWIAIADHERKMRPRELTQARIDDARGWINTPDKTFPATCRVVGPLDDDLGAVTVPAFRVDEYRVSFVDLSVPDDLERVLPFAEQVTAVIRELPVIAGVMGLGFYLPVALDSLAWYLPRTGLRYRAAIRPTVDGGTMGVRRTAEGFRWDEQPHVHPGLPDIGWRTIAGLDFLDRLGDLAELDERDDVEVERLPTMTLVTAGERPVWGDVEARDDLAPYRAVARALAPVRYPHEVAIGSLFGDQEFDRPDLVRAYVDRFDDDGA
jgi:hypothetical protein